MTGNKKTVSWREDPWQEGKWLDLWSVNHVLAGILIVPALNWIGLSPLWIFIVSFIILFGWEVSEWIREMEALTNQFMDMVTNYLGFGFSWYLYFIVDKSFGVVWFWAIAAFFIVLELWGWLSYKHKWKDQEEE